VTTRSNGAPLALAAAGLLAAAAALRRRGSRNAGLVQVKVLLDPARGGRVTGDDEIVRLEWQGEDRKSRSVTILGRELQRTGALDVEEKNSRTNLVQSLNLFAAWVHSLRFPLPLYRGLSLRGNENYRADYPEAQFWSTDERVALRFARTGHPGSRMQLLQSEPVSADLVHWLSTLGQFLIYSAEPDFGSGLEEEYEISTMVDPKVVRVQEIVPRPELLRGSRSARASRGEQYQSATLTGDHAVEPQVLAARRWVDEARLQGKFLGNGHFGDVYLYEGKVVKYPRLVAGWWPSNPQQRSPESARAYLLHEAGVANELWALGHRVVPRTLFVESATSGPALVREYGEAPGPVSISELSALEQSLWAVEADGWEVSDELLVLRRPDGSLFVADVGWWRLARPGPKDALDQSEIRNLIINWAEAMGFAIEVIDALKENLDFQVRSVNRVLDSLPPSLPDVAFDLLSEDLGPSLLGPMVARKSVGLAVPPSAEAALGRVEALLAPRGRKIWLPQGGLPVGHWGRRMKRLVEVREASGSAATTVDVSRLLDQILLRRSSPALRLYHGGQIWVRSPGPGARLVPSVELALTQARKAMMGRKPPRAGLISVFEVRPGAKIKSFDTLSSAHAHYKVTSEAGLARAAAKEGVDLIQVANLTVLAQPSSVKYLGFNFAFPESGRVSTRAEVRRVLTQLNDRTLRQMQSSGWRSRHQGRHSAPTAWDINDGGCEEWAGEAVGLLGAKTGRSAATYAFAEFESDWLEAEGLPPVTVDEDDDSRDHDIAHTVLSYEGRWFDAQHPDGVDTLSELSISRGVDLQSWIDGQA